MPKPILYYHPASPPVRAVLLVAKEINLDLELRLVDLLKAEQLNPEYVKINPLHTVPTLDDNGHIVSDSHAIITYLIDKYAPNDSLYPKDLAVRSIINQRLHFDSGILFAAGRGIITRIINEGLTDFPEDTKNQIQATNDMINALFKDNKYIVGDTLTVADFSCVTTVLAKELVVPLDRKAYPKIAAWTDRMKALPYFDEINTKNLELFKKQLDGILAKNRAAKSN